MFSLQLLGILKPTSRACQSQVLHERFIVCGGTSIKNAVFNENSVSEAALYKPLEIVLSSIE